MVCENEICIKEEMVNNNSERENGKLAAYRNELESLKNEPDEVISELLASRNGSQLLRDELKMLRNKSRVFEKAEQLLEDRSLLVRNELHAVKKETRVLGNKSLLVKDKFDEIRKEAQLIRHKLLQSRDKFYDAKKDMYKFIYESEKRKEARINHINERLEKHDRKISQISDRLEKSFREKSDNSTKISELLELRNEAKEYMNKTTKYMNEARKYRDEILKLVSTSEKSGKECIDTSDIIDTDNDSFDEETMEVIDNDDSIEETVNNDTDSIDEKIIEEIIGVVNDNDSIDEKIIEGVVDNNEEAVNITDDAKKENRLSILEGVKPDINIDSKILIEMCNIVTDYIYGYNNWGKRRITWIFWGSHVSEVCKKWIHGDDNYAYTRFEGFSTCTAEVRFTNKHKTVFSEKEVRRYIDINDLEIFRDFYGDSKTVFKNIPVTAETIKMIKAKKAKDLEDSCLKKIEEYACIIEKNMIC